MKAGLVTELKNFLELAKEFRLNDSCEALWTLVGQAGEGAEDQRDQPFANRGRRGETIIRELWRGGGG